ncbi:chemotaxis protein CheW [Roseomonas sp. OT10]|uniref:chemotaxis protein CheW n=1 Tax=Roseomonas cutis TaxID=2897332 RepID=UPI001E4D312D|nr:chemotaxis protein CheW [Roseomonas sp. OT10]UFN51138.1 chemotaxis protein CheW [Roseomonas sp. OT10]
MSDKAPGHARETEVFLTLGVAGQLCGVPVQGVRDVLAPQAISRIPLAPPAVAGSLNLRGRIVTAIDLRRRLGLPDAEAAPMPVVMEHGGEFYALLADEVGDVVRLAEAGFDAVPPTLAASWRAACRAVHRDVPGREGRLLVLLDVPWIMALHEVGG